MEKNKLLKVSSILLIVFGVLIALMAFIVFVAADLVIDIMGQAGTGLETDVAFDAAVVKAAVMFVGGLFLVTAIVYLVAGVVGIMQKSAKLCFIIAIVLMAISGVLAILYIVGDSILFGILFLIIPVLYLVGAIQFKKAAADEQMQAAETVNNDQPM